MKKIKQLFKKLYFRKKAKKLCFLSAMFGYKYTCDWIMNNIPEAGYLIGDYVKTHPAEQKELFTEYFKSPDYILDKAEKRLNYIVQLEEGGFDIDESTYLRMGEDDDR